MPAVEFEEKELELHLNVQLAMGGLFWSPGQVLENVVGFDAALRVQNAVFWMQTGYSAAPPGVVVRTVWWPHAKVGAFVHRAPPPFTLNAFLQYKRPEYLYGPRAKERARWGKLYYRFYLDREQQRALEACSKAVGVNGIVAYGSPAFYERSVFWGHVENSGLVPNTHFVEAVRLAGHGRYTYADATKAGQAHSRPIDVEPLLLRARLSGNNDGPPRRPPPVDGGQGRPPATILEDARIAAEAAVRVSSTLVGSEQHFRRRVEATQALVPEDAQQQPVKGLHCC